MSRSGDQRVGWPHLPSTTHLCRGVVLRKWRERAAGPRVLGRKGSTDSQRTLCLPPFTHYSLMVPATIGRSSNTPFREQACHNVTPIWRSVLERGYLWTVPWRAGPRMLFEQYLGFLGFSPAYKNKEKKIPNKNR